MFSPGQAGRNEIQPRLWAGVELDNGGVRRLWGETTLKPGVQEATASGQTATRPVCKSDVAILELRDEACEFRDSDGNTVTGSKRRLITHLTLKDGRVLYERPAV
jgi:hypothetical protein